MESVNSSKSVSKDIEKIKSKFGKKHPVCNLLLTSNYSDRKNFPEFLEKIYHLLKNRPEQKLKIVQHFINGETYESLQGYVFGLN